MISQTRILEQMIYLGIFSIKANVSLPEDGNLYPFMIVKLIYTYQFLKQ